MSVTPSTITGTPNPDPVWLAELLGTVAHNDLAFDRWRARLAMAPVVADTLAQLPATQSETPPVAIAPLRHDPAQAVAFLKSFDASGWHNLWSFHPETDAKAGRTFPPNSWDKIAAFVNAHQGSNIYFSVNEPKSDAPHDKLRKKDIAAARAVWSDFDPDKDKELAGEGEVDRERLSSLVATLSADAAAPPSVVIDSGGGFQTLWHLQSKLAADEFSKLCEDQTNGILKRFGGDKSVWDLCRVLRLPGTVNHPDKNKRDRGRVPRQATVLAATRRRYTLDALAQWTAPVATSGGSADASKWWRRRAVASGPRYRSGRSFAGSSAPHNAWSRCPEGATPEPLPHPLNRVET